MNPRSPHAGRAALAAVLLVAAAGPTGCGEPEAVAAEEEAVVLPVQVQVARAREAYRVREEYVGRVTSRRKSQLGFERSGRLERLPVDEGDRVAEGDLLAALDVRELAARRRELVAQVDETEARLALARRTTRRQNQLRDSDHTSEAQLDAAVFEERALASRLEAARAALASVDVALELSLLEAPYAGIVTARRADEGSVVSPGEPVFELIEDGAMEVRVGMPPQTAAGLEPGVRIEVSVAGRTAPAVLHATLPSVEPDTRTVTAIFRLDEEPGDPVRGIPDGALARVPVERWVPAQGFWLPVGALAESRRGLWSAYVVSPGEDGFATVDRRQLEVLHTEADRVFVRGTLRDGERIVSGGVHRLVPGQKVRVVDDAALARRRPGRRSE